MLEKQKKVLKTLALKLTLVTSTCGHPGSCNVLSKYIYCNALIITPDKDRFTLDNRRK